MMESFRIFLESEESENVKKTVSKLPKTHQKLLDGYKFKYTPGNTLQGDDQHIGYIHQDKIVVAAPWFYSRSFTTLHEIAHLVFEKLMTPELKKKWEKLFQSTKKEQLAKTSKECRSSLNQGAEEIFCMVYANVYSKHKIETYNHPKWVDFIEKEVP